jgi:GT2 family glycosyltransferase
MLPDGSTQQSVYPFPTIPFTLAYVCGATRHIGWLARRWHIDRGFDPDHGREVSWAVGAFLLVRRLAWEAVGGFDEAQWMYAEDLDLGWRMRRAGWATRFVPEARVLHAEAASTSQAWGSARYARWHASTYAWMARRRGFPMTRAVAAINVAGYLARAAATLPRAMAGNQEARGACRGAFDAARTHSVGLRERSRLERVR